MTAIRPVPTFNDLTERLQYITTVWDMLAVSSWDPQAGRTLAACIATFTADSHAYGFVGFRVDLLHLHDLFNLHSYTGITPTAGDIAFISQTLAVICGAFSTLTTIPDQVSATEKRWNSVTCNACRLEQACAWVHERRPNPSRI